MREARERPPLDEGRANEGDALRRASVREHITPTATFSVALDLVREVAS